jgi:hypothetical protein
MVDDDGGHGVGLRSSTRGAGLQSSPGGMGHFAVTHTFVWAQGGRQVQRGLVHLKRGMKLAPNGFIACFLYSAH